MVSSGEMMMIGGPFEKNKTTVLRRYCVNSMIQCNSGGWTVGGSINFVTMILTVHLVCGTPARL